MFNIIYYSRRLGKTRTVRLNPRWLVGASVGVLTLTLSLGAVVTYWMKDESAAQTPTSALVLQQQEELEAMSARLADIQAKILQLDALGAHMAEQANARGDEFKFQQTPAVRPAAPASGERPNESAQLHQEIDRLLAEVDAREVKLRALDQLLQTRRQAEIQLAVYPVQNGYISSSFGMRTDPIHGGARFHAGIDFVGPPGADIYSVADGVVTKAASHPAYGFFIDIDHGQGLVTRYAHASRLLVRAGDLVHAGQHIAAMGSTGRSTGVHLHFEVIRNGQHVNPSQMLRVAQR